MSSMKRFKDLAHQLCWLELISPWQKTMLEVTIEERGFTEEDAFIDFLEEEHGISKQLSRNLLDV